VPSIGKVRLAVLTPQHVQRMQHVLADKGLGPKSIDLVRATLSGALTQATRWGLIVRNPVALVERPPDEAEEPKPLTPEQAAAFLVAARGHVLEPLFTVMMATGLRIGEALGLGWQDIDLEKRRLHVRQQLTIIPGEPWALTAPKSKSGRRIIPLIPPALAALRTQRSRVLEMRLRVGEVWTDHNLVFCREDGSPLIGRTVEYQFKRLLEKAKLPAAFTPHTLRHSTATYLMAMGVPHRAIMGHSELAMTVRYEHVLESVLEDAAERLARIFPATGTEG
jgi:integrase